jgi:hypothetical protein
VLVEEVGRIPMDTLEDLRSEWGSLRRRKLYLISEGHASLISSSPPSMTPKLVTHGSAAVGATLISTPTAISLFPSDCLPILMG